jgi:hypothetical protein
MLLLILTTFFILYLTWHIANSLKNSNNWKQLQSKLAIWKANRLSKINEARQKYAHKLEKSKVQLVLSLDAVGLLKALNEGQLTSTEILLVYFDRATSLGLENELIGEILIDEAFQTAQHCDKVRKLIFENGKAKYRRK